MTKILEIPKFVLYFFVKPNNEYERRNLWSSLFLKLIWITMANDLRLTCCPDLVKILVNAVAKLELVGSWTAGDLDVASTTVSRHVLSGIKV
jgi:hypothetical protein